MDFASMNMKERPVRFGKDSHLVGVITEACTADSVSVSTAAIILNAGIIHRIGPNRLHTQLARKLAKAGFKVLRFDLSGLGDSDVRKQALPSDESNLRDVQEAIDAVSNSGSIDRFVLMGICSGADLAIQVARVEPRVVGALLIEGYNFMSPSYHLDYFMRRFVSPQTWVKLIRGKLRIMDILKTLFRLIRPKDPDAETEAQQVWQLPSTEAIISSLRALMERGTDLCFVYAKDSPAHHIFCSRIKKEIKRVDPQRRIQVIVLDRTDHTFTPLSQQDRLIGAACLWFQKTFNQNSV